MTDLSWASLSELRTGLDTRQFSACELTAALLERVERCRELNAFITVCRDEAMRAAADADQRLAHGERKPLLGIPIAIKDAILTNSVRTTCASRILEHFIPPYDATVTGKLREAGATILGKTNMDEFAMGSSNENSAFGPVKNPWAPSRVAGGSSGGSAAAVAAGLTPGALGTDTGGSVRQPAAFCGIAGLKPTYGRVSRQGVVAFASSLDQVGTFCRSVSDLAVLTQTICGHDPLDSTSVPQPVPDFQAVLGHEVRGLRIGVPQEYFSGEIQPEVAQAVTAAITTLASLGAEQVPLSLPHTEAAVATYYIIAPAEASSNLSRFDGVKFGYRAPNPANLNDLYCRSRAEGFGTEVKRRILVGTYVLSKGYYDEYYRRAQKVRRLLTQDFERAFRQCDVIACPVSPTTAFPIGAKIEDPMAMYLSDIFTLPASLAGLPSISIPCGFDGDGLPIGIQLIAKPWDEAALFKTAFAYESAVDWHRRSPSC